jgi:TonB-dependent SusC/RagA subfamily outer membrane receptor
MKTLIITLALLFVSFKTLDSGFLTFVQTRLVQYNEQLPQEKIYVQTDKPFYEPSDVIWLKAYLLDGATHTPTAASGVVYVDFINPKGSVEKQLILPISKGEAKGNLLLDENLAGGLYKLRAYTLYMKNFGQNEVFEKQIQVQKVLTPRLLMKLDFERKSYGAGETATADFEVKDLENNPLKEEIFYEVQLQGKQLLTEKIKTDAQGKAKISFTLPKVLESNDGLLNVVVNYEGNTESISRSVPIVLNQIDLQFFPEGGDWIAGVPTRLAFKAMNEFGKPADIEGDILDKSGNVVSHFKSFHQGMGSFVLTSEGKNVYQARITQPAVSKLYDLPKPKTEGLALQVENKGNLLNLNVYTSENQTVYAVAQSRGKHYFSTEIKAQKGKNTLEIPLKDFPAGIAQITLFNFAKQPVCERLVFVNPHKNLKVSLKTNKKQYSPREKVKLTVQTTDENEKAVSANLSLAVVDDQLIAFADDKQDNILSHFLMSSDLKGKIHEPYFYFKKDEPKAIPALDLVMLTNGWRLFVWKEVLDTNAPLAKFYPEKTGAVSGTLYNAKNNKPVEGKVTLVELGGKNRSIQLETDDYGNFTFIDVNPSTPVQLFAEVPRLNSKHILFQMITKQSVSEMSNLSHWEKEKAEKSNKSVLAELQKTGMNAKVKETQVEANETTVFNGNQDFSLEADVKSLSEVVVTGYGYQEKKSLTGSTSSVIIGNYNNFQGNLLPRNDIAQTMQGRIAGVTIQQNGNAGNSNLLRIRGASTLSGTSDVLLVVDNVPMTLQEGSNFLQSIPVQQISDITVVKSGAAALYGSRAANGAIVVTTKRNNNYNYYPQTYINTDKNLATIILSPRQFSAEREFYAPVYERAQASDTREDFRKTIYWNPDVRTDADGKAELTFYNSDQITNFRITAEGIGKGLVGRAEETYFTQNPLNIDIKIPPYLTFDDEVLIPILLKNNTEEKIEGELNMESAYQSVSFQEYAKTQILQPKEAKQVLIPVKVLSKAGEDFIQLSFKKGEKTEKIVLPIDVQPKGFPTSLSYSAQKLNNNFEFMLSEPLKGSLKAEFKAYPNLIANLMSGLESMLREPYGCFEQTSSVTYPNILVLQYLQETGKADKTIEQKALGLIEKGYKRLLGFETSQDGFEWFGKTPPHLGITAYGLMEFTEMKKVYRGVDEKMIARTKEWLLNKRDGKGGFVMDDRRMYEFYDSGDELVNAYVVYALSEAGVKEINKEYEKSYDFAQKGADLYLKALLANASFNFGEVTKGKKLLEEMLENLEKQGWEKVSMQTSFTYSWGRSLAVETASLVLMAMLKHPQLDIEKTQKILDFIMEKRYHGGFGSTQATIMALRAITAYTKFNKQTSDSGKILVYLNSQLIHQEQYDKGKRGEITIPNLVQYLKTGKQVFSVKFEGTETPLPYAVDIKWNALTPATDTQCQVGIETQLADKQTKVGNTLRLSTTLRNKTKEPLPMTLAVVGLPSGMSAQAWQLKELQEKQVFDFYEVHKNYIVFYYRSLAPQEVRQVHLDLKADIAGTYQAPASTAYLYYYNELKDWRAGEMVRVER